MPSHSSLIERLRSELPPGSGKPQPHRAFIAVPLALFLFGNLWFFIEKSPPWYAAVPLSLLAGMAWSSFTILGHETLHGSVVRSRFLQNLISYPALALFCVTPTLWRVWHNQVHHAHTNDPALDPDTFGTAKRFQKLPFDAFQFKWTAGSGHWLSLFYPFYILTLEGQQVLWFKSGEYAKMFPAFRRRRAVVETLALIAFWIALGIFAGPRGALYGILIPMAVGNLVLDGYIMTQHLLRPLGQSDEPVENSMSVSSPRWVDWIHLNFSHHVEHHYFPSMSPRFAPQVRKSLKKIAGDRYLAPPHWKACLWVFRTPRLYENGEVLVDPYSQRRVKITDVETQLRRNSSEAGG